MHTGEKRGAISNGQVIPVDMGDVRGFLANCLRAQGFEKIQTPRRSHKVTATRKSSLQGTSNWKIEFEIAIRFEAAAGGVSLDYQVMETAHHLNEQSCRKVLGKLMATVAADAQDWAQCKREEQPSTTYGAARFATEVELQQQDYVSNEIEPDRFIVAPYENGRYITVPRPQTCYHGLICGPTGAGKSSGFFIPNIVSRHNSSAIVTEATAGDEVPELYLNTAGWRQFKRNKIYFFNPGEAIGTRINPLDKLKYVGESEFPSVADELAELVIVNTTPPSAQRSDPIWDKAEKHLLWILIMHVAASRDPELAHLGAIRQLVRQSENKILRDLQSSKSEIAAQELASFLAHSSENFRHGVFSGLLQRLNPWLTDKIVTMTKTTDLDLGQLRNELFTFYLSVPSRKRHLKPIAALVFNFLLDLALEHEFKHPLALFLDEFTNFGAIPGIDDALSIIRKRKLPVVLGVQSLSQIKKLYRDSYDNILSLLGTRVFFRPRMKETAQDISEELGVKTVRLEDTNDSGITSVREFGQPLMSISDIKNMAEDDVLVMLPTAKPLLIKRFTYKNFPAPVQFDPPELVRHSVETTEAQLPQSQADAIAAEARSQTVVTQTERDYIRETERKHADLEETRKQKRRTVLEAEDWNIPG